jgi:translocation and assembly module TamB
MQAPTADAAVRLSFPKWRKLSAYALSLDAASRTDSLRASFAIEQQNRRLLDGSVRLPASVSLLSGTASIPDDATLNLRIESEKISLSDFNELLPDFLTLGGNAQLRFLASGPISDPMLDGALRADELEISMADGTRGRADVDVSVGGTSKGPRIGGRIEVVGGALRIPEAQRNLHSTSGSAVLWEIEQFQPPTIGAEADSLAPATAAKNGEPESPPLPPLDLDVEVEIPSGLWIRGRGLEVELAGQLRVTQTGSMMPTITGSLHAVRGQLVFVGRVFSIERGQVVFYGGDEINPSLDLALSTRIDEMIFRILFKGTATKPELILSSEPEMTEGDIMAYLLFGRPIGELDSGQVAHLEGRVSDVASSYAIAQLQGRISSQLGVDMLTIRQGKATGQRSALVVGKYLSRRALLKYEQALESTTDFFVNLEYFVSRTLKVETLIGSQSQSAIEINWSRRF